MTRKTNGDPNDLFFLIPGNWVANCFEAGRTKVTRAQLAKRGYNADALARRGLINPAPKPEPEFAPTPDPPPAEKTGNFAGFSEPAPEEKTGNFAGFPDPEPKPKSSQSKHRK